MPPLLRAATAAAAAAAAAASVASRAPPTIPGNWTRVLLDQTHGAACIDGTPPAVYVKPGVGENATKVILFFEGGGWCVSLEDCEGRSYTALGSSSTYAPSTTAWSARDLLLPDADVNPNFASWASAYAPYCDGQSRAGDTDVQYNSTRTLHYRGFRNLQATLDYLTGPGGALGGGDATHLIVSGSSAGGLTTYLHIDFIAAAARASNPGIVVRAIPEVGFFLDAESIWDRAHLFTEVYTRIAEFANVTGGAPEQVNAECVASTPPADRWQCFMAQYTYPHIQTPVFVLNSAWDEWQTENILAPNLNTTETVSTYAPFMPCIKDPSTGCNATQFAQWDGYGQQFFHAWNASVAATPAQRIAQNGAFLTSCPIHTTAISGLSHRIHIRNVSMYDAFSAWVFDQPPPTGSHFTVDVPWPGNPTCPKPSSTVMDEVRATGQQ